MGCQPALRQPAIIHGANHEDWKAPAARTVSGTRRDFARCGRRRSRPAKSRSRARCAVFGLRPTEFVTLEPRNEASGDVETRGDLILGLEAKVS